MQKQKIQKLKSRLSKKRVILPSVVLLFFALLFTPGVINAQASNIQKDSGSTRSRPNQAEARKRPALVKRTNWTRRVGEVNKEVCGRDRGCVKKLQKEQKRRGGNCGGTTGNAKACNLLSDGRIVGTENGLGSKGKAGGKVVSRKLFAKGGGVASLGIGGILLNGKDQVTDPDYVDGNRYYVITIQGKGTDGKTKPLQGVTVALTVHSKDNEKQGCRNNGSGSGVFSPTVSEKTDGGGTVGFESCPHQQISINLSNIPKGYKGIASQNGAALSIKSAQDEDLNTQFDNGRIVITLDAAQPQRKKTSVAQPKKARQEDCSKIAEQVLSNEKDPQGSQGLSGGSRVTYFDNSRFVKIHNIMNANSYEDLNVPKNTSKGCQEQMSHSRTYVVRAWNVNYPLAKGERAQRVKGNFSVELQFNGPGSCKTANPGKSGNDNVVYFKGCTRNQIDIKIPSPDNYPVVHQYKPKAGYVRVYGNPSKKGSIVNIDIYFENELKHYSNADFAKFVGAANKYWWERRMEGANNGHPQWGVHNAKCKPADVTFRYENQAVKKTFVSASKGDEVAEASDLYMAYRPKSEGVCYIRINTEGKWIGLMGNKRLACMVFVHEYGHLLGYGHAPSVKNIMYDYPTAVDKYVWGKTGC